MWEYRAKLVRVIDGDTLEVALDVGFYITITTRIRLLGVNTPELHGEQRADGLRAKEFVTRELEGKNLTVCTRKADKYGGRWDGTVQYTSPGDPKPKDLSQELIRLGYARKYEID